MSRMLPYPGRYESHDSWMRRCDSWERDRKSDNDSRWNGSPNSRGLTVKQAGKLSKVQAKLPDGWNYTVTNDNQQICIAARNDPSLCCASKSNGQVTGHVGGQGVRGAVMSILLNRAIAAVWGKSLNFYDSFTQQEWRAAYQEVREGLPSFLPEPESYDEVYSNDNH